MRYALQSIASLMLRRGITAHEFARWAEVAFVDAAVSQLVAQGVDPSFSRISALTGIQRHAVSDILGGSGNPRSTDGEGKAYQRNRLARVLTGWFEDPRFTTDDGRPRVLALEGEGISFSELVRVYSGDIYPGIILDELERVGAVRRRDDGAVEAISRRYTIGGADEESLRHAEQVAADIMRTIEHNTRAAPVERHYEDGAIASGLPADVVPMLSRLLERRAAAFLDDLEGWLASMESPENGGVLPSRKVRAGVRVVMVVEPEADSVDGARSD